MEFVLVRILIKEFSFILSEKRLCCGGFLKFAKSFFLYYYPACGLWLECLDLYFLLPNRDGSLPFYFFCSSITVSSASACFHQNGFTIWCVPCHKKRKEIFLLPTPRQGRSEAALASSTRPLMDADSSGEEVLIKVSQLYCGRLMANFDSWKGINSCHYYYVQLMIWFLLYDFSLYDLVLTHRYNDISYVLDLPLIYSTWLTVLSKLRFF